MTGTRFAAYWTAASMSLQCSSTSTVGDSPVVPTITMPLVPSATCQSMSDFNRARSSAPSASIGVTMATRLPESMRRRGPCGLWESGNFSTLFLRFPAGGDALDGGRSRLADGEVLVSDHPQLAAHRFEQFTRYQQVGGIRRLSETLVALRECFVD